MKVLKNKFTLGAEKTFKILHITDCHLVCVGENDNERKHTLAINRSKAFGDSLCHDRYQKITEYGRENSDVIICTGDLIDFTSNKAFEVLEKECHRNNLIFAVGNHEFSQYVGEAKEDFTYKMQSYASIQNCISRNIDFDSRVINGVNFITLDNAYYDFTAKQLELLRAECQKEYPVVLCMHTPIYHEECFKERQGGNPATAAYLCGAPDELIQGYSEDRYEQQKANRETLNFIDFVLSSHSIKLILAGHLHDNYICEFENGLTQVITHGTFAGYAREIEIE